MRRILIIAGLLLAVALAICLPKIESVRLWRIAQTKQLFAGISMRAEDMYIYQNQDGSGKLLRVQCRFLGGNPNDNYSLRARVCNVSTSTEPNPQKSWWVGIQDDGDGGLPMVWEFNTIPTERHFILRVYYQSKSGNGTEQHIDFTLPNLPKVTSNGEV